MDKRKFLFVSLSGLIGDIAWQVLKEGHDVRYYIEAEKERDIADGFVPKSKDWEKDAKWSDIVVFDDTLGQGEKAQVLRAAGKPVVGGTPYTDRLEDDRSFGQEELKAAGVSIIPYEDFDSFDLAIDFVKKNPDRYVIKPSGEAQNVKRRLFVGEEEDGDDVVRMLEAYKKPSPTRSRFSSSSVASTASKSPSVLSSTGKNSSLRSTSISNTKNFSPEKSVRYRRDGHRHVLERAQSPLQPYASQDGVQALCRGLRRLRGFELYREQQRNLSLGIHLAIRLSHHQHSTGRHAHAHQRFLLGTCHRRRAQMAHSQRLSNRHSNRRPAVSLR